MKLHEVLTELSLNPKANFEFETENNEWFKFYPNEWFVSTAAKFNFRKVVIQTKYEVTKPKAEEKPLTVNETYYTPFLNHPSHQYTVYAWKHDKFDKYFLENGLIYLDKEDAIKATKAMLGEKE